MSMSIERAVELLDPDLRVTANTTIADLNAILEEFAQACRMGMGALRALNEMRWIPVGERLPDRDDALVLVVCQADLGNDGYFLDAIQLAEYHEADDVWELEGWPEAKDVTVSHWRRLPTLPAELLP